jgi:hypothetical protein
MNKYPERDTVVQQLKLAGCTPAKYGESTEWTSILNSAEEKRNAFAEVWMEAAS